MKLIKIMSLFLLFVLVICSCRGIINNMSISLIDNTSTESVILPGNDVSSEQSVNLSTSSKKDDSPVSVANSSGNSIMTNYFKDVIGMNNTQIIEERFKIKLPQNHQVVDVIIDDIKDEKTGDLMMHNITCAAKVQIQKEDMDVFANNIQSYGKQEIIMPDQIPYYKGSIDWWDIDKNMIKYYFLKYFENTKPQPGQVLSKNNHFEIFITSDDSDVAYIYFYLIYAEGYSVGN